MKEKKVKGMKRKREKVTQIHFSEVQTALGCHAVSVVIRTVSEVIIPYPRSYPFSNSLCTSSCV
jgi:hypothetical protein